MTKTKSIRFEPEDGERSTLADPKFAVARKTVDIFSGITGRRLVLKDGEAATDGVVVSAPMESPHAYRIIERHLAHVLFKTDPAARDRFAERYAKRVSEQAASEIDEDKFAGMVREVVNILDLRRVLSLWGELYFGSAEEIRALVAQAAKKEIPDPHAGVLPFIATLVCAGGVEAGPQDRFRAVVEEAAKRVEGRSYSVTLATSRWLVVRLVDEFLRSAIKSTNDADGQSQDSGSDGNLPQQGSERISALCELLEEAGEVPDRFRKRLDTVSLPRLRERGADSESDATAAEALSVHPTDDMFLQSGEKAMAAVISDALEKLAGGGVKGERLYKEANSKVVFHKQADASGDPVPNLPGDEDSVRRMRAFFVRVMGRKRSVLDDFGTEVDVPAFLERKLTGQPVPCFRRVESGQGFHAMVLLDLSQSMTNKEKGEKYNRIQQAYRACRIISEALDFPFVKLTIWGYTAHNDGQADITIIDPKSGLAHVPGVKALGTTPLHVALRVAAQHLEGGRDARHLFAITDGRPTYCLRDGVQVHWKTLVKDCGKEVAAIRRRGISVTGAMIGTEVEDLHLRTMFGSQPFWKRLTGDAFADDLVSLVTRSFISFLRSR